MMYIIYLYNIYYDALNALLHLGIWVQTRLDLDADPTINQTPTVNLDPYFCRLGLWVTI